LKPFICLQTRHTEAFLQLDLWNLGWKRCWFFLWNTTRFSAFPCSFRG